MLRLPSGRHSSWGGASVRRVALPVFWVHSARMALLNLAVVAALTPAASVAAPSEVSLDRLPLVLGGEMAGEGALQEELELRLPDHAIVVPESPAEFPPAFLWIGAARSSEGVVELQVIVSDGRLYQRPLVLPTEGDRARVMAGAIANLVDGIERKRVAPTRTEVEVPELVVLEDVRPSVEPRTTSEAPTHLQEAPPEADPSPTDAGPQLAGSLHLSAGGVFAVGLGPPTALTGPVGAGATFGVAWVRNDGLLLGGGLRSMGWRASGLSVGRVRLLAHVGYAWTRESWSVVASGGPSLEPLWLGASVRQPSGGTRNSFLLVGATVSGGPRWRAWSSDGGPSVWLGPDLDVSVSAEARASPGVVFVQGAGTAKGLLRAGGLELAVAGVVELRVPRSR